LIADESRIVVLPTTTTTTSGASLKREAPPDAYTNRQRKSAKYERPSYAGAQHKLREHRVERANPKGKNKTRNHAQTDLIFNPDKAPLNAGTAERQTQNPKKNPHKNR